MLRKLACEGVANERAVNIVHIVAECLGVKIIGSVSARSIPRIMLEGLVQARMQVAYELNLANCKFIIQVDTIKLLISLTN